MHRATWRRGEPIRGGTPTTEPGNLRASDAGAVLAQSEAAARARGYSLVYLVTFSLQAPPLYRRLGFESGCRLKGSPRV